MPIPPEASRAFNAFTRFAQDGDPAHVADLDAAAIERMLAVFARDSGSPAYVAGQQRLDFLRRQESEESRAVIAERARRGDQKQRWVDRGWGFAIGTAASLIPALSD